MTRFRHRAATALLLLVVTSCTRQAASSTAPEPTRRAAPRPGIQQQVVLVSLDGFRWDYLQRPFAVNLRRLAAARCARATDDPGVSVAHISKSLQPRDRALPRTSRHHLQHDLRFDARHVSHLRHERGTQSGVVGRGADLGHGREPGPARRCILLARQRGGTAWRAAHPLAALQRPLSERRPRGQRADLAHVARRRSRSR